MITTGSLRAFVLAGVLALTGTACGDDDEGSGDLRATCTLLEEISGSEEINDETLDDLDALLDVAPEDIRGAIQTVRDAFAEDGEAAFDDPEVVTAFESVGAFEAEECAE